MKNKTDQTPREKAQKQESENPDDIRIGRKSLTMPSGKAGRNRVRYVEGTKKLKDGCWLSED